MTSLIFVWKKGWDDYFLFVHESDPPKTRKTCQSFVFFLEEDHADSFRKFSPFQGVEQPTKGGEFRRSPDPRSIGSEGWEKIRFLVVDPWTFTGGPWTHEAVGWLGSYNVFSAEVTDFSWKYIVTHGKPSALHHFSFQLETWNWHFPFPLKLSWLSVSAKAFPIFCSSSNASYVFPPGRTCSTLLAARSLLKEQHQSRSEFEWWNPTQYLLGFTIFQTLKTKWFFGELE